MSIKQQNSSKTEDILNMLKLVWAGLTFYPLVMVFVAFKVLAPKEIVEIPIEPVFQLLAAGVLIASHIVPKLMNKRYRAMLKEKDEKQILQAYFPGFIIALSLSESVVIFGFILVSMTGNPNKIIPFAMAAVLNLIYLYPRKDQILGTSDRIT